MFPTRGRAVSPQQPGQRHPDEVDSAGHSRRPGRHRPRRRRPHGARQAGAAARPKASRATDRRLRRRREARRHAPRRLHRNNTRFAEVDDEGSSPLATRAKRPSSAGSSAPSRHGVLVLLPNDKFVPAPVPQDHFIDRHVVEKLNRLKIAPSPLARRGISAPRPTRSDRRAAEADEVRSFLPTGARRSARRSSKPCSSGRSSSITGR